VTTAPWLTLTAIGVVYVGSIPLTIRAYYRLRRAAGVRRNEPAQPVAPVSPPAASYPMTGEEAPANQWRH
jgi:CDP-diacylglycerol--serine O-phosphatidyltransferase